MWYIGTSVYSGHSCGTSISEATSVKGQHTSRKQWHSSGRALESVCEAATRALLDNCMVLGCFQAAGMGGWYGRLLYRLFFFLFFFSSFSFFFPLSFLFLFLFFVVFVCFTVFFYFFFFFSAWRVRCA